MQTTRDTHTNAGKAAQVELALNELLAAAMKRGFHGSVAVEVAVQDGTIQNFRRRYERLER